MSNEQWEALYGPPASNPPHKPGEFLLYHEGNLVENGEILYVTEDEQGLCYVVSPAGDAFPTPVRPGQIIAGM